MSESFEAYWERLCKSTPPLRHEQNNMTQEIAKFKECLRRAYQAGKGSQVSRSEAADDFGKVGRPGLGLLDDLIKNVFGKV